ncbi:MAG: HlyD family efflux transporter periplasmic adaptor subunit [Cyanothece sp. SIO2G6]|nr:HlyD family efflux transporter periplasmic adaptor subunit [Cyanothece sp. SIO2G6]
MAASSHPNHTTPFRVVPPQTQPGVNSPAKRPSSPNRDNSNRDNPDSDNPDSDNLDSDNLDSDDPSRDNSEAITPSSSRRFPLKLLLMAGGLTLAGFIQMPYQVGGEVTLAWPEGERQSVRSPIPAVIEEFYVAPGDKVSVGQPLLKLNSRELDTEIASLQERLAHAHEQFHEAQREQIQAEARLIQTKAQAQAVQVRAERLQTRLDNLAQGILPPDMQALVIQRDRLQGQLDMAHIEWERYQTLYAQGAIALADVEVKEQRYYNVQRDLNAKEREIQLAQQQLSDLTIDEQGSADFQQANVMAAHQVVQATERVKSHQNTITVLEQRLQELQQQSTELVLQSTQSGTVLDRDLDLRLGEAVTPDDTLLRIANLGHLTAEVQVKQEDKDFVQPGAAVTFRPDSDKLTVYDATVVRVVPNLEADQTQQRRVAIVQVMIDNSEGNLLPNSSGYAKIFSQRMPLYQRIGREVIKLWPSKFL